MDVFFRASRAVGKQDREIAIDLLCVIQRNLQVIGIHANRVPTECEECGWHHRQRDLIGP